MQRSLSAAGIRRRARRPGGLGRSLGAHGGQGNQGAVFQHAAELFQGAFCDGSPLSKTGSLLRGHIQGFHFFGGVMRRISYDNLKTAVYRILEGPIYQQAIQRGNEILDIIGFK